MLARDLLLKSMHEFVERLTADSRPELLERLLRAVTQLGEADGAAVLLSHHRMSERLTFSCADPKIERVENPRTVSELTRVLLRSGHAMSIVDLETDSMASEAERCPGVDAGPALFVPLKHRDHSFGTLSIYRTRGRERFNPESMHLLSTLGAWGSMALHNLRLAESLGKLAVTDDLTQVYNFRFLKTALRREIKRAGRFHQMLSLVMVDVDNLKGYNDRNGHMRGSLLLRELAELFAQHVRSFDLVAKYGGDEFTLILPQTDLEGALTVAERMRSVVANHTFPLAETGQITVSLGVAVFPADATDPIGLIQASDRALYAAKKGGRNRVESVRQLAA